MISTTTLVTRQEAPVQRQKSALADRQIFVDEPVDRLTATRSSLQNEWGAMVASLGSFADLISPYWVVPQHHADTYSLLDEYDLADYWRVLLYRSRQLSQLREEELLDWDVTIKTLSTRPSMTILASVEYRGRAKPSPVVDPWD